MKHRAVTRTLYVGGFGALATADALRVLFAGHGDIEDLRLVDRGEASFAYVTFVAEADAIAARARLDGMQIAGRTLRVERAQ